MTEEASAEVQQRIKDSFSKQGLMNTLGARLGEVKNGEVHIHLPMSAAVTQQHGYFHGGGTGTIADSAGGYAALTMMDSSSEVLSVEYKINFLSPAIGDELEAVGTVIKPGRTLSTCRLEVFAVTGEKRKLIASGQQTLIRVDVA